MKGTRFILGIVCLIVWLGSVGTLAEYVTTIQAARVENYWKEVDQVFGKTGVRHPDGVLKFGFPRRDLRVTLRGVIIRPTLALGSWVAFKRINSTAMVMGDMVLTENEVNPVMDRLFQRGISITAIHNHLLHESPRVMYLHIEGHGDPVQMARTLRSALEITKTPLKARESTSYTWLSLDTKKIDQILGHSGQWSDGVYQMNIPRAEPIMENGMEIPPSMGTATAINFQPTGGHRAAITGDFVLTAQEVNTVAQALRKHGIEVTALHNHMLNEQPRLFFMHFWANGDVPKLAKGLRVALDQTHSQR
ncbi:hypothetical protein JIR001_07710 [Polycladomyces abyssicola]|uniref:Peptidase M23 n=1 Tax=Polycladomyces abyssicola TaxID=1125966 RepID=A0A8D5ZN51_9BACL|nr:DUF1259 domain-containing protein [Polycladomyces abyssicola]BCU80988.1 hypothetical protein JIR001_07710 [Polycladomyces abyssicola]